VIIDSHQHVFWHNRNDADLIADMDAHGFDVAWLLSRSTRVGDFPRKPPSGVEPETPSLQNWCSAN
jgi:hypothetical protein